MATRADRSILTNNICTVPPIASIVTVTQAKEWARVQTDSENDIVSSVIKSARQWVENHLNRALITQTRKAYYRQYGCEVHLPYGQHQSIGVVEQIAFDNSKTVLTEDSDFYVKPENDDTIFMDKYLSFPSGGTVPPGYDSDDNTRAFGLTVTFVCGYGDASTDVPEPILVALRMIITDAFENRQDNIIGTISTDVPMPAQKLLQPYRLTII